MRTNFILETRRVAGRIKTLTAFGLLAVMVALLSFGASASEPAHAQTSTNPKTFTVNSTADNADKKPGDGSCFTGKRDVAKQEECTLRAAIQEANAHAGADKIHFNIPSPPTPDNPPPGNEVDSPDDPSSPSEDEEVKTITIPADNELPRITDTVTIDGYTQPGAKENTKRFGNDAVLLIELRSSDEVRNYTRGLHGLLFQGAPNSVVRGLAINGFQNNINIFSRQIHVQGNFLGTDASGTTGAENGDVGGGGVSAVGNDHNIGGNTFWSPADRNVISGNNFYGIWLSGDNNHVRGNFIGTTKDGTGDLGNGIGVVVYGRKNIVGDADPNTANTIAFSRWRSGVEVWYDRSTGNNILGNSIFSNSGLGIDLIPGNPDSSWKNTTPNDPPNDPKDPDTGPNNLQNHPELTFAQRNTAEGTVGIVGKLNSTPGRTFRIDFFSSLEADPSGFGEGKTWVGQGRYTTNDQGDVEFQILLPGQRVSEGDRISATATDESTGGTSEFSKVVTAVSDDEFEWEDETF
jgi:CSLREA domain-containing protein